MGEIKLGTVKGSSIFFKFNSTPSDQGASDHWETGMKYIGFASGLTKPQSGYIWAKFVGEDGADGVNGQDGRDGTEKMVQTVKTEQMVKMRLSLLQQQVLLE